MADGDLGGGTTAGRGAAPPGRLTLPIGSVDPSGEDALICGWAWNETVPARPTRLVILLDGERVATVTPQDFRPDLVEAGIGHGCFAFRWRLPDACRDGKPHQVRVFHAEFRQELPGSPRMVTLPAQGQAPRAGRLAAPFENPDFADWPDGIRGRTAPGRAGIAPGLVLTAEEACGAGRFMLTGPQLPDGVTPIYGLRVDFDGRGGWWLHHRLAPRLPREAPQGAALSLSLSPTISPSMSREPVVELAIELALGEAEEPVAQRPCAVWLTRQAGTGFEPVRCLLRGRVFRRPTLLAYRLRLTAEERGLAAAKRLHVGVTVERCRSFTLYPSQLVRGHEPPPDGFRGFEDTRLAGALEACRQLARVNGRSAAFDRLLPALEAEPPEAEAPEAKARAPAAAARSPAPGQAPSPATHYPFTQIIVPVHNGGPVVMDCLNAIRRETTTPFQVLLVNDGSRAPTTAMLRALATADPRFLLFDRAGNKGYTKSVKEGVALTGADWIVILNSDTVVPQGWLARLHDAAASRPDTGMVGPLSNAASHQSVPRVREPGGGWSRNGFLEPAHVALVQARLDEVTERAYPAVPFLNGFCTLIRRAVFDRCGPFDEEAFPIGYGEENDLCLRASQAGFALLVADDCFVYHRKGASFGAKGRKPLARAGALELANKHLGVPLPALEQAMQEEPALARLRLALSDLAERVR